MSTTPNESSSGAESTGRRTRHAARDSDARASGGVSRRSFVGLVGATAAATVAVTAGPAAAEQPFRAAGRPDGGQRPNILFIMADDMGWADLSSYGAPHICTPNLDRLAARGVRFTDGYAGSSTCSPTRIGTYTGRYPGRLVGGLAEPISGPPSESAGLPPEHPTLASLLRDAGYATAMYGKWHCGELPWFSPLKSGWDEWLGNLSGGVDYFSKVTNSGKYDLYEDDVPYQDLRYYTDILTERTVDYIERPHDKPWLLNLNYTTPHWPWEGPGDQALSDELTARAKSGEPRVLFHTDGGSVAKYVEMVQDLDASIGTVLKALRTSEQERNTIVVFKSDNGGERFSYQWPLRGAKQDVLEGGIRVPTIMRWPAVVRGGQVSDLPVVSMDWTRTLLAAAGVDPHPEYPMDGRDLSEHLWGSGRLPEGDLFWRVVDQGALRRGKWKYWVTFDVDRNVVEERLFDLSADEREEADLSQKQPAELVALRDAWNRIEEGLLDYPPGAVRYA
ncbi:sulfatase-like hydrolase/transferase [Modestobacter marinus]|uniref:Arylsulfatase A-like enzyme n=1 Tax=Modestobacter marinus TaxID=477641 RepID=A0A846LLV0_9ACTN|nr:sulfatase-like hydrolase/transferase [Modestobacter marinus]NIH68457.1 arylsulfatase A-like enzyme [Modestobacter marinus]GGL57364.1 N-acetylgalactosamine-6-sulfatase [Modestobacter marinus]